MTRLGRVSPRRPELPLGTANRVKLSDGMSHSNVMLTIGRRLINVMTTLWTQQQDYDRDKIPVAA